MCTSWFHKLIQFDENFFQYGLHKSAFLFESLLFIVDMFVNCYLLELKLLLEAMIMRKYLFQYIKWKYSNAK